MFWGLWSEYYCVEVGLKREQRCDREWAVARCRGVQGMRFLITNDDGFDAPGLQALWEALVPLGAVEVVAPAVCHSSKGHAVDTKNSIRVEQRDVEPFGRIRVVQASPADCIRVGLRHVMLENPPDVVVAGINPGANLGVDLFYSGTAAAAREAALLGVPAIAVSRLIHNDFPIDWRVLSGQVSRVVRLLLRPEYGLPVGHFWNVNFPTVAGERYPEELVFVPHGTDPHAVRFQVLESCADAEVLGYSAVYRDRPRAAGSDVDVLFSQRITVTPVGPSLTSLQSPHLQTVVSLGSAASPD